MEENKENTTTETTEGLTKAINLDNLNVFKGELQARYPTKEEVTAQIEGAALGGVSYATTQDILALFEEPGQGDSGGEQGT